MLSRSLHIFFRGSQKKLTAQQILFNSTASLPDLKSEDRDDPAPYFFNPEIHAMLKIITNPKDDKVFRRRLDGATLEAPTYKFMTDEDLKIAMDEIAVKREKLLQMPPVVKIRGKCDTFIDRDTALAGHDENNLIITDITYNVAEKNRLIVVREPDGTLRHANWDERHRMCQIYFPRPGRDYERPKMFEDEYLKPVLERGDYEFILDRCCVQFDPDDADYHKFTQVVYEYINDQQHYDKLLSTRHYGPMVFYLAWNQKIENLLLNYIETDRLEDAALLVQIYYAVNPNTDKIIKNMGDSVSYIRHYIDNHCSSKRKLDQALKMYLELQKSKKEMEKNIKLAHGIDESKDSNQ